MFEDLFREEGDYPPSDYTQTTRRPFLILAGGLSGIAVITLMCLAVYVFILIPRNNSRGATQTAQVAIQDAIAAALTQPSETAVQPTTAPPPTASPTQPEVPTDTPSPSPTRSPTPLPVDTTTPTASLVPTELPQIVLSDPLGGPGSGWPVTMAENFEINYQSGGYRMFVNIPFADIWSIRDRPFEDLILEVDLQLESGPDNGFYGVICRFQDSANYYGFVIDNAGNARIFKKVSGVVSDLANSEGSAPISPGESNRLRGDCIGDTLTIYVNGERLFDTQDDEFTSGSFGLLAGTLQSIGLEVIFDNFLLATP